MEDARDFGGLLSAMYDALSDDIAPLGIAAYLSPEPLPFAERLSGRPVELREGEPWGERLFDCAWMRFDAEVPEGESPAGLALKIDINGELFIADAAGSPVCGLTCKSSNFCDVLGKPGKTFYELPESLKGARKFSVWADCGLNDLFGNVKGGGKVECARLVRLNPGMRRLMHDFEFAHSMAYDFDGPPELLDPLKKALAEAAELLSADLRGNMEAASGILEAAIFSEGARPALEVSAVGHAHMDLAWLWPVRETRRKLARTFATALMLGEKYPDYHYGASQPQAYAWMKRDYPGLYGRIKDAVARGRIEPLGCMWVEPDCNLPSGESFIRQILHGRGFFREEFGVSPDHFWIPDSFGYSPQLPQILSKSGVGYFVTQKMSWNTINRFPHHSFWWEGIDGSRVLAHMLPEETYNSPALPRSAVKIEREYAQRGVSENALMAFGIGDGGGGPGIEHLERIRRNAKASRLPKIVQRSVPEFLKRLESEAVKFPVWRGDLYLEKHQGTFTTQGANKRHNRRCEALLKDAEYFMYLLEMFSKKRADRSWLDGVWKEVLLYQFHDILPGSSIKRVYDESRAAYERLEEGLDAYIFGAAEKIADILGGRCVFAPLYGVDDSGRLGVLTRSRDSDDFAEYALLADTEEPFDGVLENEYLAARFAPDGRLVSLKSADGGGEFIGPEGGNALLVYEDMGDAWDFGYEYRDRPPEKMRLEESAWIPALETARLKFSYGSSTLTQYVRLEEDTLRFDVDLDWRDRRRMLRLRVPLGFEAEKSASEVAFGYYEREVDDAGEWRRARIETPAHQWADMRGKGAGLALINDAKYGYRLKDNAVEMNVLRCVPCPGSPLVSASDKSEDGVPDENRDFADIGGQRFSYALYPHGAFDVPQITRRARALNSPAVCAGKIRGGGKDPASIFVLPFKVSTDKVEIAAVKPAEDGKTWILRMVNLTAGRAEAGVEFAFPPSRVTEVDLAENGVSESADMENLSFGPHEIRSFRLVYDAP